jgi:hypothetical protein
MDIKYCTIQNGIITGVHDRDLNEELLPEGVKVVQTKIDKPERFLGKSEELLSMNEEELSDILSQDAASRNKEKIKQLIKQLSPFVQLTEEGKKLLEQ